MNKQALIYRNAKPISKERHSDWSVKTEIDYSFTCDLNWVPLTSVEFFVSSREYPIVFVKSGENYSAVALLGLREDENLFLRNDGTWHGAYLPAFLRRYPFVLAHSPEERDFTFCIDEASDLAGSDVTGERLFDEDGNETDYFRRHLDFATKWEKASQETLDFCTRLVELDLLEDTKIEYELPDGQKAAIRGFATVDREKLYGLASEDALELFSSNSLEVIFAHLNSLRSIEAMSKNIVQEERLLN